MIGPGAAAGHPETARAGVEILRSGGSAADAAVAMVLVSCAAETIFTGLGGGGFATYYDAGARTVHCLDFFVAVPGLDGRSPGRGTPIEVTFVGLPVPYDIGPATVAVPGVPAGAYALWQRWGRLPWAEVVAPGLAASDGTPLPSAHATLLPDLVGAMLAGEGARVYARPDGTLLQAGDLLVHPDQRRAYQALLTDPAGFYTGDVAAALLEVVADGGALSAQDLASYRVIETEPVPVEVAGTTVWARGDDLDDVLGTFGRAARTVTGDPLTDPDSALALVAALRATDRRAETTNLVAVDADGNGCAVTTSLGLGAGVWVPGYGVHLNSMLGEGELIRDPLQPGVRMGSMMSPLVGLDSERRLSLVAGAAGGSRIRPALVQSVLRMLSGTEPQAAIDAPRLTAPPGSVRLEPGFAPDVLQALEAAGNAIVIAPRQIPYFGGVSALTARGVAADARRGGVAIGL